MVLSLPETEAARARAAERPDIHLVHLGESARAHAMGLAKEIRAAGIAVTFDFVERRLKKAMAIADQSGARYALIVGDEEVAKGLYGLKNLATGEQQALDLSAIIQFTKDLS